jgi:hypothetical protein
MGTLWITGHAILTHTTTNKRTLMRLRDMQTTQERRNIVSAVEQGIRIRAKRNNLLRHAYDDIQQEKPQRSWKRHRKTQWK